VPKHELQCGAACIDALQPPENVPKPGVCNCCGSKSDLETLPCCGVTVCNREKQEYQAGSWSREFCGRSHRRSTHCMTHYEAPASFLSPPWIAPGFVAAVPAAPLGYLIPAR
jgi:hypothetical protein